MQQAGTPETDPAARVAPALRLAAPWRVVSVEALDGHRLRVAFRDGTTGEMHLRTFLESAVPNGTIFEELRRPEIFAKAGVELGAVTWPNGADLAPDAMYDAIRADGRWVVGG